MATDNVVIVPPTGTFKLESDVERRTRIDGELLNMVNLHVQQAKDALRMASMLAAEIHSPLIRDIAEFKIANLYS